jgi:cell fate regulator YaaT (PSP1 superfamily)
VCDVAAKKCGGSCSVPATASGATDHAAEACGPTLPATATASDGTASEFPTVLRRASQDEIRRANELRKAEEEDRQRIVAKVREHKLEMKVSDVEWQWDRHQMTVFFSAEQRVDFRALVRELASAFRTRIDLRQIGVRDEAARIGGVGRCGREYCCSTWLPELSPVNLSLAKNQSLSLNPSQISGGCGRLLCCLKYEHEFYVTSRKRFPREGKTVETLRGTEKVIAVDIFRERVYLRGADESRTIGLEELREEMEGASGGAVIVAARAPERQERQVRPERRAREQRPLQQRPTASPETVLNVPAAPAAPAAPESPAAPGVPERAKKRRRRRRRRGGGGATGENTNPSGPATE